MQAVGMVNLILHRVLLSLVNLNIVQNLWCLSGVRPTLTKHSGDCYMLHDTI